MHIGRVAIENFRNFYELDVRLGPDSVIVGENAVGKSNLIYALRLVLDPSLPDAFRQLRPEDFWDGISRPIQPSEKITISIDFEKFEDDEDQLASLADHLVSADPMVARLTFEFFSESVKGKERWKHLTYGGDRRDNPVSHELRRRIAMEFVPALRDAEGDLANWRRSPLRPMLSKAADAMPPAKKKLLSARMTSAAKRLLEDRRIAQIERRVTGQLSALVGESQSKTVTLGLENTDADRLIRSLRLMVDRGSRTIGEASLGLANTLYLTLRILELGALSDERERDQTFFVIEEPEAHLHPQLQRTVFRGLLRPRRHIAGRRSTRGRHTSILLTTHSPHIASVTPLRSVVVLRSTDSGTIARSTIGLGLRRRDREDLERYIDVTRAEILFARKALLVEGDAELFIVPRIAMMLGIDLDELGIVVCSVSGTNFAPYIKLLIQLGTPFAVITDKDPRIGKEALGDLRVAKLNQIIMSLGADRNQCRTFVGESTLEIDLANGGWAAELATAIEELSSVATHVSFAMRLKRLTSLDARNQTLLLRAINKIGKGRFAQRFATILGNVTRVPLAPAYLTDALRFLRDVT